jgi:CTP synthase
MEEQKNVDDYGGTMRLGAYQCELRDGSLAQRIYGQKSIYERHRHRYEFNNTYREKLEQDGLVVSGINPKKNLVEIVELPEHRWFLACQFHPEFRSRPMEPHPLFESFVGACLSGVKQRRNTGESDAC